MRVSNILGGLLTALALAACDSPVSPNVGTGTVERYSASQRGARLAADICASCHGASFEGSSVGASTSPALECVAEYSLGEFTRLLRTGVTHDGRDVRPTMQAPTALHVDEIADLYEFFLTYDAQK